MGHWLLMNTYLKTLYIKYSCDFYCVPRNETSQFCIGWVKSDWKRDFGSFHSDLVDEIVKVNEWKISRSSVDDWERKREEEQVIDLEIDSTTSIIVHVLLHPVRSRTFVSRTFKSVSFLRSDNSRRPSRPNNFGKPILSMSSRRQCQST